MLVLGDIALAIGLVDGNGPPLYREKVFLVIVWEYSVK